MTRTGCFFIFSKIATGQQPYPGAGIAGDAGLVV